MQQELGPRYIKSGFRITDHHEQLNRWKVGTRVPRREVWIWFPLFIASGMLRGVAVELNRRPGVPKRFQCTRWYPPSHLPLAGLVIWKTAEMGTLICSGLLSWWTARFYGSHKVAQSAIHFQQKEVPMLFSPNLGRRKETNSLTKMDQFPPKYHETPWPYYSLSSFSMQENRKWRSKSSMSGQNPTS